MTEQKQKKQDSTVKVVASDGTFNIFPTGQTIGSTPEPVVLDGWVQANIDKGLLKVCS